jgi:tritrans,polycis-undecaprenyl-diphosphate synthase [geranylgeranyl-diphosphate specific]
MNGIHLGLIPDGNRRWARAHGLPPTEGHKRGAQVMEEFLRWCLKDDRIGELSIYGLSTENLQKRSQQELRCLYRLMQEYFRKLLDSKEIYEYEVRVKVLGNYYKLPDSVVRLIRELMDATRRHSKRFLNILVAYGAQDELLHSVRSLARSLLAGRLARVTEAALRKHLWVGRPLDLVIRTGGDHRLSNFMLYQAAYAELIFVDKYWPDFTYEDFKQCMEKFEGAQRRMGGDLPEFV